MQGKSTKKRWLSGIAEELFNQNRLDVHDKMLLVMWRDLELIGIDKDTLVQVAPLSDVPLKTALKLLLNAAASRNVMFDYTVVDGMIVIAKTKPTLSKFGPEMWVYDVTDLVQPPAEAPLER